MFNTGCGNSWPVCPKCHPHREPHVYMQISFSLDTTAQEGIKHFQLNMSEKLLISLKYNSVLCQDFIYP